MLLIYVDGDACPVKDEILRVAERYNLQVIWVSNQTMRMNYNSCVKVVTVGSGFDEADNWIADHAMALDIVITADILLASRCIKKGANVLGHSGKMLTPDNIGSALAGRELSAHLRDIGESAGYHAPFSKKDRSQFLQSLDQIIVKIKRLPHVDR